MEIPFDVFFVSDEEDRENHPFTLTLDLKKSEIRIENDYYQRSMRIYSWTEIFVKEQFKEFLNDIIDDYLILKNFSETKGK